jgi:phage terminase small subunit
MLRKAEESRQKLASPRSGLRPRHELFVAEYLIDWNATAAYKRAGYRARGHSAEVNASRLRKRPDVRRVCAAKVREQLARIDACREAARAGDRLAGILLRARS